MLHAASGVIALIAESGLFDIPDQQTAKFQSCFTTVHFHIPFQGSRRKVSGGSAAALMPSGPADTEYDRLSEAEVWLRMQRLMETAKQKQGAPLAAVHLHPHPQACI